MTRMDEDRVVLIGLSDYEYLLEIFWIDRGTHPLVGEKVSYHPTFAGFPANLARLKHRSADQ